MPLSPDPNSLALQALVDAGVAPTPEAVSAWLVDVTLRAGRRFGYDDYDPMASVSVEAIIAVILTDGAA
jgi:hypothetical protein